MPLDARRRLKIANEKKYCEENSWVEFRIFQCRQRRNCVKVSLVADRTNFQPSALTEHSAYQRLTNLFYLSLVRLLLLPAPGRFFFLLTLLLMRIKARYCYTKTSPRLSPVWKHFKGEDSERMCHKIVCDKVFPSSVCRKYCELCGWGALMADSPYPASL